MDNMPPLPESEYGLCFYDEGGFHDFGGNGYTADQMHAYARAYAEQRCAPLVEALKMLIEASQHYGEMMWYGEQKDTPWEKARAALTASENK